MVYENPHSLLLPITDTTAYTLFSVFIILLSLFILFTIFSEQQHSGHGYTVEEDEYNFMASEESEQSRLDLASAYLDIQQTEEAKSLLQELLHSRNPITKEKAKQLLKRI